MRKEVKITRRSTSEGIMVGEAKKEWNTGWCWNKTEYNLFMYPDMAGVYTDKGKNLKTTETCQSHVQVWINEDLVPHENYSIATMQ